MSSPISGVPYEEQDFEKVPGGFIPSREEKIEMTLTEAVFSPDTEIQRLRLKEEPTEEEKDKDAETFIDAHPLS